MNELVPLDEGGEVIPTQALQETQKEVIGGQVDLPGRFPILTDGVQFNLAEDFYLNPHHKDGENLRAVEAMVRRMIDHARKTLAADGRNLEDCRVTVTMAVHHKGQATDFWIGDAPDRKQVDKMLTENLNKPQNGQYVEVRRR